MATLTIRNPNDQLKSRLRIRAATRGRSMEEEARQILQAALIAAETEAPSLVDSMRSRFAKLVTRNARDFEGCGVTLVDLLRYPS